MAREPRTICLVACAAKKLDRAAPASDIYISALFRAARTYAEGVADEWLILSALHGLLEPKTVIEPYNITLNGMGSPARRRWASEVASALAPRLRAGDTIIFLAGKNYRRGLVEELSRHGCNIHIPLEGMGIGRQLQALNRMTKVISDNRDA